MAMTIMIELSEEEAQALKAKATAHGLSVENWLQRLAAQQAQDVSVPSQRSEAARRPIWDVIQDNMKDVPPEEMAALPKDGASQIDHYVYGLPKRNP